MSTYPSRHVPGPSQALIRLKAPSVVSDLDDGVSEYTASTVNPGSSVSSRSVRKSRSNKVPYSYHREHGSDASSRSSQSGFHSPSSERSVASSKSSQTSYSRASPSSSGTPSIYHASFSSSRSNTASSISTSTRYSATRSKSHTSESSPTYDSSILAIYLASLRNQTPTAVHQFLLSNDRFRDFRPHLSAMADEAFQWFSDNVRSKNRDLVRGIESGRASSAVERVVRHAGQEWEQWVPRGRREGRGDLESLGRDGGGGHVGRPGLERRVSEVSYEQVWVQNGRTYTQRLSVSE